MGSVKVKDVAGYAAGGAATGTAIAPGIGTAIGAIGGGLYGLFSDLASTDDADVAAANAAKLDALKQAGVDIAAYRPQLMAQEQNGINHQLGQFQGAQDALATMYGGHQAPAAAAPGAPMGQYTNPVTANQGHAISPADLARPAAGVNAQRMPATQQPMPISPMNMRRS